MADLPGFDQYCRTNRLLWGEGTRAQPVGEPPRVIFVDLWHNNVQYLLRSLLVSKYLQCVRPARLVGLTGQPGVVPRSCGAPDLALVERLTRSFGVDEIVRTGPAAAADYSHADRLLDRLEPSGIPVSPALLRERLASLTLADGFPIGRFIYDTTLRSELRPTIERVDVRLRHWAADCLRMHRWVQDLIQTHAGGLATFVTGHLDYSPWGLTGEAVRRSGGEVLWFRPDNNVPLVRIGADAPGTLNAAYHRAEAEWFEGRIWPMRQRFATGLQRFMDQGASGVLHRRWNAVGTPRLPPATAKAAASALRRAYGWKQADVVVGIFAHALSDQPLADEQTYADRFQWLSETLTFAARHPGRRWVVKLHPRDAEYDATGSTGELRRRFGRMPHIRFINTKVATGLMEALCDCAVTLFGAPGLELAMAGRPVIVAGRGPYTGCGFVHQALDRAHYEALLLAGPTELGPSPDQVERARLYAYAASAIGAASSPLLDPIMTAATDTYWELAEARLRHHVPACDDLHEAIRRLIQGEERRSTNPTLNRLCWADATSALSAADAALPLLGSDPLHLCAGGDGVAGLLEGFGASEAFGVWAIEAAVVIGFRLRAPVTDEWVRLSVGFRSLGSEPDWPWPTASVFTSHSCLVEGVTLAGEGALEIDAPASAITEDGTIVLSVLVDDLRAPAAMGLNGDARALGIGLTTVCLVPHLMNKSEGAPGAGGEHEVGSHASMGRRRTRLSAAA